MKKLALSKRILKLVVSVAVMSLMLSLIPANLSHGLVLKIEASSVKIGDYLVMGKYLDEQVLWRCVDIDENGPLMLADKILTAKAFDAPGAHKYSNGNDQAEGEALPGATGEPVGYPVYWNRTLTGTNLWEISKLRSWLNSNQELVFSKDELAAVKLVSLKELYNAADRGKIDAALETSKPTKTAAPTAQPTAEASPTSSELKFDPSLATLMQNYDTAYSYKLIEKIFLLDVKQLNQVYKNSATLGKDYFIAKLSPGTNGQYWLRTPMSGKENASAIRYVNYEGAVYYTYATDATIGVRPAFYLDAKTANITSGTGSLEAPYLYSGITSYVPAVKTASATPAGAQNNTLIYVLAIVGIIVVFVVINSNRKKAKAKL